MTHPRIAVGARVRVLQATFVDLSEETFGTVTSNTENIELGGCRHPYRVTLDPGSRAARTNKHGILASGLEVVPETKPARALLPRPTVRERDGLLAEIAALEGGLKEAIAEVDRATEWMSGERETLVKQRDAAENLVDVLKLEVAAALKDLSEAREDLDRNLALRDYVETHLLNAEGRLLVNGFTHGYVAGCDA